ncbi:hypothetical protein C8J57DRAFT_1501601 [Mycena rebaudengoi]|nr:hypothetical protein C8J57DRAFT_1501601 [Mycena rebaudengoi]
MQFTTESLRVLILVVILLQLVSAAVVLFPGIGESNTRLDYSPSIALLNVLWLAPPDTRPDYVHDTCSRRFIEGVLTLTVFDKSNRSR